jgi:hypothetical protein
MAVLRPTSETGVYEVEGLGTKIRLIEWRAGSFYDSVAFAAGAITPGTNQLLFQNLQNKNRQHTNLDNNAGRLPALTELICNRIGAHITQAVGSSVTVDTDIIQLAHAAYMQVFVNQDRRVADQPLYTFQSGYGITGTTTRNATGVVTTGVASAAAAPQLLVAQPIGPNDALTGKIQVDAATWIAGYANPSLAATNVVTVFLDGLIKKPQGA